jgi:hypothetical protein
VPAAVTCNDAIKLNRAPGIWLILMNRRRVSQNRIDNRPRSFHAVLTDEQHGVTPKRIVQQALVRRHLIGLRLPHDKFDSLTGHRLAGQLRSRAQRDGDIGTQTKPKIIRVTLRNRVEDGLRRALELNQYFGCRDRHLFSRTDIERDSRPPPRVNVHLDRGESLYLRIRSDSFLIAVAPELPADDVRPR